MTLCLMICILLVGAVLAWVARAWSANAPRWVSIGALTLDAGLLLRLWANWTSPARPGGIWNVETNVPWIPRFGINFHLGADGLSLLMAGLTVFLGFIAVAASWSEVRERTGAFHFNLLAALAGLLGVFFAADLFLFFVCYEVMLVPMYFLIYLWGQDPHGRASTKFIIFTQAGGLLMLLSILGLYYAHGSATNHYTMDYAELLHTPGASGSTLLLLGFVLAFIVKLPAVPFHSWQPDTYAAAPTGGGIVLSGLMAKAGAYGLLRFAIPLFPEAAHRLAPCAMLIAVVGIIYGAVLAFSQSDFRRLIGYSSISHLGFVLLGAFAMNSVAYQGAVMIMVCHGISVGGLFVLAGVLQQRAQTRDLDRLGGLWNVAPRMGAAGMVLALATLGLPGLGNFIGEFLVLFGTYRVSVGWTAIATFGAVLSTIYALWMVRRVFFGPRQENTAIRDLSTGQTGIAAVMIAALALLGVFPQPVLDLARPAPRATGAAPTAMVTHIHPNRVSRDDAHSGVKP